MYKTTKLLLASSTFAAALCGWQWASAHHAFSMFDRDKRQVISGTVTDYSWTNPHVWLYVIVPDEATGTDVEWPLEGPAIRGMAEKGWSRSSVKPGDSVTLVVHPQKDGLPGGHMIAARLPDGRILQVRGPAPELESSGEEAGE